ncbi:hypothetical protein VCV18_006146 [Metarhizium anisopliae]
MSTRQYPPLDVPCNLEDAKAAVATGVDGVDLVIGTARKRGPILVRGLVPFRSSRPALTIQGR